VKKGETKRGRKMTLRRDWGRSEKELKKEGH